MKKLLLGSVAILGLTAANPWNGNISLSVPDHIWKNIAMLSLCVFMLSGCTFTPQQALLGFKAVKAVGSEKVADKWLSRQERQVCSIPIDALERRYADNPTKYRHYLKFCGHRVGKE